MDSNNIEHGSEEDDHDAEDEKLNSVTTCLDVNIPNCPICLLTFSDQDIGTPESCDHHFCLTCIIEWSKNVNTCPFDRQVFHIIFARHQVGGEIYEKIAVADRALDDTEDDEQPTYCEVCGLCTGEERLLLCDGCDNGYHLECLNPPLATVPVEEWYCSDCTTPQPSTSTGSQHALGTRGIPRTLGNRRVYRRVQQIFSDSSSDENDGDMECEDEFATESDDEQILYCLADEPDALASTPDAKNNRKRKGTVRRKKIKRRSTKKSTGGKRKRSRRKKSRRQTWWKKRIAKAAPSSVKKRLADRLGLCAPPTGCILPMVKSKKQSVDNEGLSMFGDTNSLDDVDAWRKVNKLKADTHQSLYGSAVSSPVTLSTDLLGSILDSQALLCTRSKDIEINRDGTLSRRSSTADLPAFANETKPMVAVEQKNTEKVSQNDDSLSNNDVTCCGNTQFAKASYSPERSKSGNHSGSSCMDNGESKISTKQSLHESNMRSALVCVEKNEDAFHNVSQKEDGCLVEIKKHNILTRCSPNIQDKESCQSEHSKNGLNKNHIIEALSKLPDQLIQIAPVHIIVNPVTIKREGRRKYDSRDKPKLTISSVDEQYSDTGSDIVVLTPPPKTPEEVIELSTDSDDERRARQAKKSTRRHQRSHSGSKRRRRSSSGRKHHRHSRQRSRSRSRRHRHSKSHSPRRNHRSSTSQRRSRTPPVRRSRSPVRRRLRSPVTRRSPSPNRRARRSPVRIRSRSPIRRRYRSPPRRSPIRRRSRSPRSRRTTIRKSSSPSRKSRTPRNSSYKTNQSQSPKQLLESSTKKRKERKRRDSDISKHNGLREQRLEGSDKRALSSNRWSSPEEESISYEKYKAATLSADLECTKRKVDGSVSEIDTSKKSTPESRPSSRKSKSHKKKRSRKSISPVASPFKSTDLRNILNKKRLANTPEESSNVDKKKKNKKKSEKKSDRSERKKRGRKKSRTVSVSENESTKTGSSKSQFNIYDKQDNADINPLEENPVPAIESDLIVTKSSPPEMFEKIAVDSSPFQTQVDSVVPEHQVKVDESIAEKTDVDIVWEKGEEPKPVPPVTVIEENVNESPYTLASDEEPYDPADGLSMLTTNIDIDEELEKKAEAQALQVIELLKNEVAEPDVEPPPPPPAALTQKPLVIDWLVQKVGSTSSNTASPMPTNEQCGHSDEPTISQASQEEDDVLTSATELTNNQLLNKMVCQERIADEVKVVLKPHYNKGIINKDEYKFIMKNCVTKIYQKSQGRVNPAKVKVFVEKYIQTTVARRKMK